MRSRKLRLGLCIVLPIAAAGGPLHAAPQVIFGWSESQQAKRISQFDTLTPEHFDRTSVVQDDDLEVSASIDTEAGFKFKGGFTDVIRSNTFLRALINKRTGETVYQVYARLNYSLEQRVFERVNFETPDGPMTVSLTVIARDAECQHAPTLKYGCLHTEDVAFALPESFIRQLAARSAERPVKPWRFRFKSQKGIDWTDDMPPSEAAGLLLAVERYRQSRKL